MPDVVKLNKKAGIIEVRSSGVVSRQDIEKSIAEVNRIHRETGHHRILVDTTRQTSMPGTVDIFELFSRFPPELRVALLALDDQVTLSDLAFTELVAKNRALQIRVFYSKKDAMKWLSI